MGGSSYAYDGVGNRVSQTVGADVTRYLLDVQPGLAVVLAATTGADVTRYVHSLRGIHAQQNTAGDWQWMVNDGLGSVRGVAGNDLSAVESRLLDPYGNVISGTGTNQTVYHFTGEPRDLNGLQYHRARFYNPALGVFPSLDPFEGGLGRPMSLNGYSWGEGNVPNLIDPSGAVCQSILPESCCGPDITNWFMRVVNANTSYDGAGQGYPSDREILMLISQGRFFEAIQILLDAREEELKPTIFRYGVYGLAVRSADIDYIALAEPLRLPANSIFELPLPTPNYLPRSGYRQQVVTLCDRCINSSDLGNFIFGIAGSAWGIDFETAVNGAQFFNFASGDAWSRFSPDIQGVIAGFRYHELYGNQSATTAYDFCERLNDLTENWHDFLDVENVPCATANLDNALTPIPYWNRYIFSNLPRRGDADTRPATPEEELYQFLDRLQFNR